MLWTLETDLENNNGL